MGRLSEIKILLCFTVKLNFSIYLMDITTAFLYDDLGKDVYQEIPQGCKNADKKKFVCKLQKALYELKVYPKRWY